MAGPQVPIDVDPATGIWTTDGLPMIYMPRHFFVNYYAAMDAALGRAKHQEMLFAASHTSAVQWARAESKTHGLRDLAVFRHYLNRLSQRGWARFTILSADLGAPSDSVAAAVRVDNSVYALQLGQTGHTECAMFAGSLAGCFEWAASDAGHPQAMTAVETQCMAQGHDHCAFEVRRAR